MPFSENLRFLRESKGLTQREVAEAVDINLRTLQNYELGKCFPRKEAVAAKLAGFYNVPLSHLLSPGDYYVLDAAKHGGTKAERELSKILNELSALFAGGRLTPEDEELVMKTLVEIYWDSKERAKEIYGHGEHNSHE
ncbi:MAG: helix-turn-helix transcriptional regulator [Clostridia bacterium]|nr:helix-turn-helix transcriptional regulator [Clostridia bacterium]